MYRDVDQTRLGVDSETKELGGLFSWVVRSMIRALVCSAKGAESHELNDAEMPYFLHIDVVGQWPYIRSFLFNDFYTYIFGIL